MAALLDSPGLDFVSGNRFPLQGDAINIVRVFGNKFLTLATNIVFSLKIKDSQSGMWVFKRKLLETIQLESDDMPISEEIKIRVATNPNLGFTEHHIPYYERGGVSKLSPIKHGIKNLLFILKLRFFGTRTN